MLSEASDGRKRKIKLFSEGSDDKKCKKELSSDAVEPSGGFFYPELRSTIVRVTLPLLSTIMSISNTLRVFYLSTRAIEISFNPLHRLTSTYFGAFV